MNLTVAEAYPTPRIVRVDQDTGDGKADEVADCWRAMGYTVRVFPRTVRAHGLSVLVKVVVLTGRKGA